MDTDKQQHAADCLAQGQYETAIAFYSQGIEADPDSRINYWQLGLAYWLQGEAWEAQAVWLSVLSNGTADEIELWTAELRQILTDEAQRRGKRSQFQQAAQLYEQILELDDTQAEIYHRLGQVFALQGKLEEAITSWKQALEIDPDCIKAHLNLAEILQKIERFEEAIPHYQRVMHSLPEGSIAHNLGLCLLEQQLDEAIAYLTQATQVNPSNASVYGDLGIAWLYQNDLDQAIYCLHQAVTLCSKFAQRYEVWIKELEQHSKLDEQTTLNARLIYSLWHELHSFETYFYLGKVLASRSTQNSIELSIATYQKALSLKPDAEAYAQLAKQWVKLGRFEAAIAAYQAALIRCPDIARYYLEMGKILAQQGYLEEAIAHYQMTIERDVNLAETYFYLGDALSLKEEWQAAIDAYQSKIELQPESYDAYDAHYRLGVLFTEQGQLSASIAHFDIAMKLTPHLAQAVSQIWAKVQHNKPDLEGLDTVPLPVDSPQGFYETTHDWAIATQRETGHYFPIHAGDFVSLALPKSLDSEADLRFRFGEVLHLPASFVAIVPDGRYWIDEWNRTAVITPDNKILGDVSPDFPILSPNHPGKHPSQHSIFKVQKLPPRQSIQGTVAVLSSLFNDAYFHWMFDVLPRLALIRFSPIDENDIDYFLVNHSLSFQQESLAKLGISKSQILAPKNYPHIQAERLIVPSFPGAISWMPLWTCDFLRNLFLDDTFLDDTNAIASKQIERLYITRNQASSRRIINESQVVEVLESFGFQSVALESMSITQQAALLHHAKVVVAPHGGGLTNIVFCQTGTTVIELFSPNYVYPCYWFISNLIQLQHYYLLGEVPFGTHFNKLLYPNARTEDIFINIAQLVDLLRLANVI